MSSGRYFSHPSDGPCWSRDWGYHTPDPLPLHIQRIILDNARRIATVQEGEPKSAERTKPVSER